MNDERCPICLCVTHVGPHGAGVCYPPEGDMNGPSGAASQLERGDNAPSREGTMSEFPEQVWLGMVRGEWPVHAFADQAQAVSWAKHTEARNQTCYIVGPVDVPQDAEVRRIQVIPESVVLVPAHPKVSQA